MMKTFIKLITVNAVLLLTFSLHAQASFGVRAGINFADLHSEPDILEGLDSKNSVGLTIAGLANFAVSDQLSIQPEVHFIQKGTKFEIEEAGQSFSSKIKLNYLEIPIHAKYKIGVGNVSGFILAGPAIGYALSAKTESCLNGECEEETIDLGDDESEFNRVEIGLSLGAGVYLNNSLFLDIRYVLGISDLSDDDGNEDETKNRGFNIGVGYMFGGDSNNR